MHDTANGPNYGPKTAQKMPSWVPKEAQHYIAHIEGGRSIRELARRGGCAPSTVMRQVRKLEQQRDDPLIDEALDSLSKTRRLCGRSVPHSITNKEFNQMSREPKREAFESTSPVDDATLERESRRVLRRLSEQGACLAVAKDMEKAVVVRELPDGRTTRTAVLDRAIAQVMALKNWISPAAKGKITRYSITAAGRAALRDFMAADESARAGFAEAPAIFGAPEGDWISPVGVDKPKAKRIRYNSAESPVMVLARRRDRDGNVFLSSDLVAAAERLREDFELAQMAQKIDWVAHLEGARCELEGDPHGFGPDAARARVAAALDDLGTGLADVVLHCCCYLEGMEQVEKQLEWSARSGKIVLRIALERLHRHFDRAGYSNMIG